MSLAARRAKAPNPADPARPIAWGAQLEVVPIRADGRRAVANYLAKYAIKSTDEAGALDHRLSAADLDQLEVSEHLGRLADTAWALGGEEAGRAALPTLGSLPGLPGALADQEPGLLDGLCRPADSSPCLAPGPGPRRRAGGSLGAASECRGSSGGGFVELRRGWLPDGG